MKILHTIQELQKVINKAPIDSKELIVFDDLVRKKLRAGELASSKFKIHYCRICFKKCWGGRCKEHRKMKGTKLSQCKPRMKIDDYNSHWDGVKRIAKIPTKELTEYIYSKLKEDNPNGMY